MNLIGTAEKSLAKYHLLHFVIGAALGVVLLASPKLAGVLVCVFLVAMLLPAIILPDFTNKWFDRFAVLAGAIAAGVIFHFLGKL
ncbi:MAG: hypothetical protein ACRD33_03760 [Candidatus Acidiferrales bacterium]